MTAEKILFFLVFVAATPFAHSMASPWSDRVFPNDYQWLLRHKIKVLEDSDNDVDSKHDKVCKTETCHQVADNLLDAMNQTADPCENFYQFTCGRWAASNPILPSAVDSNPLQKYQYLVHQRISAILAEKTEPNDILPVKKAKKWYRSCMDTEKLEKRGIKPIESLVMQAGGWPLAMKTSDWNDEDKSWQEIDSHYAGLMGHNAFYNLMTGASDDSEFGEIAILAPEILVTRGQIMRTPKYFTLLKKTVKLFAKDNGDGGSFDTNEAWKLVRFEAKLLQLIVKNEPNDPSEWINNSLPFDEFLEWYESNTTKAPRARIDWQSSIQELFDPLNVKFDPSTVTYVKNIGYMRGLGQLLKKTPLRTIVNYVHWNFISTMLRHTTESMRDDIFKLTVEHLLFGVKSRAPRWKECVAEMKMTYASAYVFSEKYFTKSTQLAARQMMKNVEIGLVANINNSNWLDEPSKKLAREKIRAMHIFLGYPEWHSNATAVSNYYKGLKIENQYLNNVLSYMRFDMKQKLMPYTKNEDEDSPTSMDPITVNAQYNEGANALNAPPVIFQSPLFTPGLPDNVNYGQTGFIIGHEMGHGFDDTGIRHGADGDESELTIKILKSYYQRAHCFVDQFDRYFGVTAGPIDEGVTLEFDDMGDTRGSITKSENIADSTGLQAVFQAYKNLNEKNGWNEPKLPGLEKFTDEQIFFIAFGSYWCGLETPEYEKITEDDPHSPGNLRVNGAVSNTKDFAKVFNCPKGSAMNPGDKCNLWAKPGSTRGVKPVKRIKGKHRNWNNQWKN